MKITVIVLLSTFDTFEGAALAGAKGLKLLIDKAAASGS
jgi:hypothetical protein